jgi:hypothetical protein
MAGQLQTLDDLTTIGDRDLASLAVGVDRWSHLLILGITIARAAAGL